MQRLTIILKNYTWLLPSLALWVGFCAVLPAQNSISAATNQEGQITVVQPTSSGVEVNLIEPDMATNRTLFELFSDDKVWVYQIMFTEDQGIMLFVAFQGEAKVGPFQFSKRDQRRNNILIVTFDLIGDQLEAVVFDGQIMGVYKNAFGDITLLTKPTFEDELLVERTLGKDGQLISETWFPVDLAVFKKEKPYSSASPNNGVKQPEDNTEPIPLPPAGGGGGN